MDWKIIVISSCVVFLTTVGYYLPYGRNKTITRTLAWSIAVITTGFCITITASESALLRMIVIVSLQLLSMKVIVAVESYSGENKLRFFQWVAFALGWFGMRPGLFEELPSKQLSFVTFVQKGATRIAIGLSLLYLSYIVEQYSIATTLFIPQLLLLVGISFILHFGILNLSIAQWRLLGVDVRELFRSPYRSRSLTEFWGKRWNVAFSEMTALIAYRPLKAKIGIQNAVVASFLLSGLLHEIAISFPVRSGYGLPMMYFGIHAIAMQLEVKSTLIQKIIGHRVVSHIWVMSLLILPMPLLFHSAFIQQVMIELRSVLLTWVTG